MDEEVILESSPLYEHLKSLEVDSTGISNLKITSCEPDASHGETATLLDKKKHYAIDTPSLQWFYRLVGTELEEGLLKNLIVKGLMNSCCLIEEHHNVLTAFLETYSPHTYSLRSHQPCCHQLVVHGIACMTCIAHKSTPLKVTLLASFVVNFAFPLIQQILTKVLTKQLRHARAHVFNIINIFEQSEALWKSIQQFCKEVQLIHLSTLRMRTGKGGTLSQTADKTTLFIRQSAQLYLSHSIASLQSDIAYLYSLVNHSVVSELGLMLTNSECPILQCDMPTLQKHHKILAVLTSEWIFYTTLLILTSNDDMKTLANQLLKLKAYNYPLQLQNALKFRKMVLDGELEPKIKFSSVKTVPDNRLALHSLYLHSRELLRLVKLAETEVLTDDMYMDIKQQISDCSSCLELACKKKKSPNQHKYEEKCDLLKTEVTVLPVAVQNEPVIDQVFVDTGECEESNGDDTLLDDYSEEAELRRQYEYFLFRELNGVIHELAKEQVNREKLMSEPDGKSREQLAKISREIVEKRDIKGLVKSAAKHVHHKSTSPEQGRNSQKLKYEYNEDESPPNVDIDFTKIASMAALNCSQLNNDTFCSGDTEDTDI